MLIDEVHLLHEPGRGSALEAGVVSRLTMVAAFSKLREVCEEGLDKVRRFPYGKGTDSELCGSDRGGDTWVLGRAWVSAQHQ